VRFWDTSAIVPLCVEEPQSEMVKSILAKDTTLVVWWATRVECISAFIRQAREGGLSLAGERQARQLLETVAETWIEIQPSETLRTTAERLLAIHSLRAADSFQLAAALQWCQRQTKGMSLVSFGTRLRDAAYKEGFTLLPAELR